MGTVKREDRRSASKRRIDEMESNRSKESGPRVARGFPPNPKQGLQKNEVPKCNDVLKDWRRLQLQLEARKKCDKM